MKQISYETTVLNKITPSAYNKTQYCVELPSNVSGNITFGITAFKENSYSASVIGLVGEFQLAKGSCRGKKQVPEVFMLLA